MELYLHTLLDSNITSMSSLNTFDANDMQSYKLGDATFYEDDLFSPPSFDEEIYFDDTLPPIYDDYCDDTYAIEFAPTITNQKDLLMWRVTNFLCLWIMIKKIM